MRRHSPYHCVLLNTVPQAPLIPLIPWAPLTPLDPKLLRTQQGRGLEEVAKPSLFSRR